MPVADLIGSFLGSRVLIVPEKQFLYCLGNTKDLRLSILCYFVKIKVFHQGILSIDREKHKQGGFKC